MFACAYHKTNIIILFFKCPLYVKMMKKLFKLNETYPFEINNTFEKLIQERLLKNNPLFSKKCNFSTYSN